MASGAIKVRSRKRNASASCEPSPKKASNAQKSVEEKEGSLNGPGMSPRSRDDRLTGSFKVGLIKEKKQRAADWSEEASLKVLFQGYCGG